MKRIGVLIMLTIYIVFVENKPLTSIYVTEPPLEELDKTDYEDEEEEEEDDDNNLINEFLYHKVIGFTEGLLNRKRQESQLENKSVDEKTKACSVMVLSNIQNVQSLLRKYRYNAKGFLIPDSVKYYIKLPQGLGSTPILVPLNDKAFSPLGGFVRYYKEVPPIPQSWKK